MHEMAAVWLRWQSPFVSDAAVWLSLKESAFVLERIEMNFKGGRLHT